LISKSMDIEDIAIPPFAAEEADAWRAKLRTRPPGHPARRTFTSSRQVSWLAGRCFRLAFPISQWPVATEARR
jgi:hypothetical protein